MLKKVNIMTNSKINYKINSELEKAILKENEYLLKTTFNELICMELKNEDHYSKVKYPYLEEYK